MHNRARMITASFLVKDLHMDWQRGARWFMQHLVDGDLASNQHGWQWTAGTGTDAAPFFRIFNPTTQGQRFNPDGTYVRRWVGELADVETAYIHEPSARPGGLPAGRHALTPPRWSGGACRARAGRAATSEQVSQVAHDLVGSVLAQRVGSGAAVDAHGELPAHLDPDLLRDGDRPRGWSLPWARSTW